MAQLVVRKLEDDVRDKLRDRAEKNGRSMEEEIREILREAVLRAPSGRRGQLGRRMAARFRRIGFTQEVEELRGQAVRAAEFESDS